MAISTVSWLKNCVRIIDQTKLPLRFEYIYCKDVRTLWKAIKNLSVRGAPAIGVAAGFGVVLGANHFKGEDQKRFSKHFNGVCDYLAASRPTAVNLFYALDQMKKVVKDNPGKTVSQLKRALLRRAKEMHQEDRDVCRKMGDYGANLIRSKSQIMTVCNAGALATVDYGTALGVMYSAKKKGKKFKVFACETRPLLQGARLTTWELRREKIDTTLICDNMAASLMQKGEVDAIFTGADRIASNGDAANKIGTYNLAVLARYHKVPFYMVAPFSTFDMTLSNGSQIPIEQRNREEVLGFKRLRTAPNDVDVYNPAFDVTDHKLITAIITAEIFSRTIHQH